MHDDPGQQAIEELTFDVKQGLRKARLSTAAGIQTKGRSKSRPPAGSCSGALRV